MPTFSITNGANKILIQFPAVFLSPVVVSLINRDD